MRILITGGGGFLGYHFCNELYNKFDEIIIIDITSPDLSEYPKNVRYLNVDIRDYNSLSRACVAVDFIIHAAAALPLYDKDTIFSTNVDGTRNVLECAVKNNVKRVVFISSTAVYGVPISHPIYEDAPLIGVGPYGESKILAEKICSEYKTRLCITIIRPKTFIGPARLGVFEILFDWVKSGKRIPIIGKGDNLFQLLDVFDLVSAIYLCLIKDESKVNDIFNVGAERFSTPKQDIGALCEYAASGARVMCVPSYLAKPILDILWRLRLSPLYRWVYDTADKESFVSVEKIKSCLGWKAKYSNAEALIRTYQWYLDNYDKISYGITHTTAWRQGILSLFKRLL